MQRNNNFDLIRLLAAIQVFVMHTTYWLEVNLSSFLAELIDWFPGVPIFFRIKGLEGFLIVSLFAAVAAILAWPLIERPTLRLKKRTTILTGKPELFARTT